MNVLPARDSCQITREGERVLVIHNKEVVLNLPWEAAVEIGRALIALGRQAEQISRIEQVIQDQAILLRAGAPVQITYAGFAEAVKEAQYNTRLRRYMANSMGNIESKEEFGMPVVSYEHE